jgi:hypothetical protein
MASGLTESVVISAVDANATLDIVRQLRDAGLVQGRDFEFKYTPPKNQLFEDLVPSSAEFFFLDAKWATFFRLKYGC